MRQKRRKKIAIKIARIRNKLFQHLLSKEAQRLLKVKPKDAEIIALKAERYVQNLLSPARADTQITYVAPIGDFRRGGGTREETEVKFTIFDLSDLELEIEQGLEVVQASRLIRITEEAYFQGGLLRIMEDLQPIIGTVDKALRMAIKEIRSRGVLVPTKGLSEKERKRKLRAVRAVELKLQDLDDDKIAQKLYLTQRQVKECLEQFADSMNLWRRKIDTKKILGIIGMPEKQFLGCQELYAEWEKSKKKSRLKKVLGRYKSRKSSLRPADVSRLRTPQHVLMWELQVGWRLYPAEARKFVRVLGEYGKLFRGLARDLGQIIYFATSEVENPAKPLSECHFVPIKLTFYAPEDRQIIKREGAVRLRGKRTLRLAQEAYEQGAFLTYEDLSFIVGYSTDTIIRIIKRYRSKGQVVPTRGEEEGIVAAAVREAKVLELYMKGQTIPQILRGNPTLTLERIERNIRDFANFVNLWEQGIPAPRIEKMTKLSAKDIAWFKKFYQAYSGSQYRWLLDQLKWRHAK